VFASETSKGHSGRDYEEFESQDHGCEVAVSQSKYSTGLTLSERHICVDERLCGTAHSARSEFYPNSSAIVRVDIVL